MRHRLNCRSTCRQKSAQLISQSRPEPLSKTAGLGIKSIQIGVSFIVLIAITIVSLSASGNHFIAIGQLQVRQRILCPSPTVPFCATAIRRVGDHRTARPALSKSKLTKIITRLRTNTFGLTCGHAIFQHSKFS